MTIVEYIVFIDRYNTCFTYLGIKTKKSEYHYKESGTKTRRKTGSRKKEEARARSPTSAYDADESDSEELPSGYHKVPIQVR